MQTAATTYNSGTTVGALSNLFSLYICVGFINISTYTPLTVYLDGFKILPLGLALL